MDLLIHETSGTFGEEEILIKKGHSSGRDAGLLASGIQAGRLFLCHLPVEGKEAILEEAEAVFPKTGIPVPLEWYTL